MPSLHHEITIDRPPEVVFEHVTDPDKVPEWIDGAEAVEVEGELREGATVRTEMRFLGIPFTNESTVTVYEPPFHWGFKGDKPFPVDVRVELQPEGDGTRVTQDSDVEPQGFFKVGAEVFARRLDKQVSEDFERLKAKLEA